MSVTSESLPDRLKNVEGTTWASIAKNTSIGVLVAWFFRNNLDTSSLKDAWMLGTGWGVKNTYYAWRFEGGTNTGRDKSPYNWMSTSLVVGGSVALSLAAASVMSPESATDDDETPPPSPSTTVVENGGNGSEQEIGYVNSSGNFVWFDGSNEPQEGDCELAFTGADLGIHDVAVNVAKAQVLLNEAGVQQGIDLVPDSDEGLVEVDGINGPQTMVGYGELFKKSGYTDIGQVCLGADFNLLRDGDLGTPNLAEFGFGG